MFCGLFVLMFSKSAYLVYLGGTGGPKKPILMYYHLKTQYSKVFLKTLLHHFDVLQLRIYGFFDRNLLPCSQQRFSYVYGDQGNVLWIACVWKFELWIIIWEATNHKFDAFHALEYKIPCLILFHVTVVLKYCPKTIKSGNRL